MPGPKTHKSETLAKTCLLCPFFVSIFWEGKIFFVNFRKLQHSTIISQEKYENAYVLIYFIYFLI